MVCLSLILVLGYATFLQACPEPISIHYEHYEGPIILHTANCNNAQQRCHDNQQQRCNDNQQQRCNDNQQQRCHDNQQKRCNDNQQQRCHDNQQKRCNDNQQQRCNDNQQQRCYDNQQQHCYDNQQYGYYGNQYKSGCCETECTCVSKHSYAPYAYGSVATNVGCGCPVAETTPLVYCVCNTYGGNGYPSNYYENQGYQGYQNCQEKCSGCKKH